MDKIDIKKVQFKPYKPETPRVVEGVIVKKHLVDKYDITYYTLKAETDDGNVYFTIKVPVEQASYEVGAALRVEGILYSRYSKQYDNTTHYITAIEKITIIA